MGNRAARAGVRATERKAVASEEEAVASEEVVIAASGADAYTINLTPDNFLGGGNYADVYKI